MTTRVTISDGKVHGHLTVAEYAKECGVEPITVRQWIKRGKLHALKIGSENFILEGTPKPGRKKKGQVDEAAKRWFTFDPGFKQYHRIIIGLRNTEDRFALRPRFEVAAFIDDKIADNFIDNIIHKHPDWDDQAMYAMKLTVLLPPMTISDESLNGKIGMLKEIDAISKKEAE